MKKVGLNMILSKNYWQDGSFGVFGRLPPTRQTVVLQNGFHNNLFQLSSSQDKVIESDLIANPSVCNQQKSQMFMKFLLSHLSHSIFSFGASMLLSVKLLRHFALHPTLPIKASGLAG